MDAAFTADAPTHSQERQGVVFDVRISTRKAYQLVRRQQHEYDDAESPAPILTCMSTRGEP